MKVKINIKEILFNYWLGRYRKKGLFILFNFSIVIVKFNNILIFFKFKNDYLERGSLTNS